MAMRGYAYFIDYTVCDSDGTELSTTKGKRPLEVLTGHSMVLPEVEKAFTKLEIGESVHLELPPEKAYGYYDEKKVKQKKRKRLKVDGELAPGNDVFVWRWWGERVPARVVEVDDEFVTFDFNHKYVGKTLSYDITVVDIEKLPEVVG